MKNHRFTALFGRTSESRKSFVINPDEIKFFFLCVLTWNKSKCHKFCSERVAFKWWLLTYRPVRIKPKCSWHFGFHIKASCFRWILSFKQNLFSTLLPDGSYNR